MSTSAPTASASADLAARFKEATSLLQAGAVEKATEQQRWRMYGLSKQVRLKDNSSQ